MKCDIWERLGSRSLGMILHKHGHINLPSSACGLKERGSGMVLPHTPFPWLLLLASCWWVANNRRRGAKNGWPDRPCWQESHEAAEVNHDQSTQWHLHLAIIRRQFPSGQLTPSRLSNKRCPPWHKAQMHWQSTEAAVALHHPPCSVWPDQGMRNPLSAELNDASAWRISMPFTDLLFNWEWQSVQQWLVLHQTEQNVFWSFCNGQFGQPSHCMGISLMHSVMMCLLND